MSNAIGAVKWFSCEEDLFLFLKKTAVMTYLFIFALLSVKISKA